MDEQALYELKEPINKAHMKNVRKAAYSKARKIYKTICTVCSLVVIVFGAMYLLQIIRFNAVFSGANAFYPIIYIAAGVFLLTHEALLGAVQLKAVKRNCNGAEPVQIWKFFEDRAEISIANNVTTYKYSELGKVTQDEGAIYLWKDSALPLYLSKACITEDKKEELFKFLEERCTGELVQDKKASAKRKISSAIYIIFAVLVVFVSVFGIRSNRYYTDFSKARTAAMGEYADASKPVAAYSVNGHIVEFSANEANDRLYTTVYLVNDGKYVKDTQRSSLWDINTWARKNAFSSQTQIAETGGLMQVYGYTGYDSAQVDTAVFPGDRNDVLTFASEGTEKTLVQQFNFEGEDYYLLVKLMGNVYEFEKLG